MKRLHASAVLAVLMLAACDGTPMQPKAAEASQPRATLSLTTPVISTASVRRVAPGLYAARGVATSSAMHLVVRKVSSSLGFSGLDSGSLVQDDTNTGQVEFQFATSTGFRYLVVAYPSEAGVDDVGQAAYTELVP